MANLSNVFMGQPESSEIVTPSSFQPSRSRCSPILTPLAYFLGQTIVVPLYFGPVEITGQDNIPAAGPVVFAPTHRARWDSIMLPLAAGRIATGRDLRFMVTSDEVQGIQGWFIRRLGGFAVNVKRPTIASLRHGIDLLLEQEMLVIYPEGNIFRDDKVRRLKPGLARIALQAEAAKPGLNVQILPVDLDYGEAYPSRGCPVQVHIGQPIAAKDYVQGSTNAEAIKSAAKCLTQDLQTRLELMVQRRQSASTSLASTG
jgi:1-acyl-sn-glycerol-3-phosphate acyltransferase